MAKQKISNGEFEIIKLIESKSLEKKADYEEFKSQADIPSATATDTQSAVAATNYLKQLFETFNIMDVVVGERGKGPSTTSDTHYRGRVFEQALNGSFDGKSEPDLGYAELKMIETSKKHTLTQVMTCGVIYEAINKAKGEYQQVWDYEDSKFFTKMQSAILVSYLKVGQQLGFDVNNVIHFSVQDPRWALELKEDWISIRNEFDEAIAEYKAGTRKRKAAGICKSDTSGNRRPNGYLGIRSDSIVITRKFFELVSKAAE